MGPMNKTSSHFGSFMHRELGKPSMHTPTQGSLIPARLTVPIENWKNLSSGMSTTKELLSTDMMKAVVFSKKMEDE